MRFIPGHARMKTRYLNDVSRTIFSSKNSHKNIHVHVHVHIHGINVVVAFRSKGSYLGFSKEKGEYIFLKAKTNLRKITVTLYEVKN